MKAFKFSLQSVLDNAINHKNECAMRLREVIEKIRNVEQEKRNMHDAIEDNANKLCSGISNAEFKNIRLFMDEIVLIIDNLELQLIQLEDVKLQRLEDLKKARIECSAYEKIKEKRYMQYLDEIRKAEEREIEELVSYKVFANMEG